MKKVVVLTVLLILFIAPPSFARINGCPAPDTTGPKGCCEKYGMPCEIKKDADMKLYYGPIFLPPPPEPIGPPVCFDESGEIPWELCN